MCTTSESLPHVLIGRRVGPDPLLTIPLVLKELRRRLFSLLYSVSEISGLFFLLGPDTCLNSCVIPLFVDVTLCLKKPISCGGAGALVQRHHMLYQKGETHDLYNIAVQVIRLIGWGIAMVSTDE